MKKPCLLLIFFAALSIMPSIPSCKIPLNKFDTSTAEISVDVLISFSNIFTELIKGLEADSINNGGKGLNEKSYSETIIGDFPNKQYIWDFGVGGKFEGILKFVLTNELQIEGAELSVSFEGFAFKEKPIGGSFSMKNSGINNNDTASFQLLLDKFSSNENALTTNWIVDQIKVGEIDKAHYLINQADFDAIGICNDGHKFAFGIKRSLMLDFSCEHLITGGLFMLVSEDSTMKIDAGEGECNNKITVSNGILKVDLYI